MLKNTALAAAFLSAGLMAWSPTAEARPGVHVSVDAGPVKVELGKKHRTKKAPHRVWVPGHWEGKGRHRHFVPGHWDRRR